MAHSCSAAPRLPAHRRISRLVPVLGMLLAGLLLFPPAADAGGTVSERQLIESLATDDAWAARAATWLGRRESVQGLRAILARRNEVLLQRYLQAFPRHYSPAPARFPYVDDHLDPRLEALLLQYLEDEELGAELLGLVDRRKYRTRRLYEALLRHARQDDGGRRAAAARRTLTHTDLPGIEADLLELLPTLPPTERRSLVALWRARQWPASALPVLRRLTLSGDPHYEPIARVGTAEAAEFLVAELERLQREASGPAAAQAMGSVLHALAQLPATTPPAMPRVIAAVAQRRDLPIAAPYIELLRLHRDEAGIDDLLALVPNPQVGYRALFALQGMESDSALARIRRGLEQLLAGGELPAGCRVTYGCSYMLETMADPARYRRWQARQACAIAMNACERQLEGRYGGWLEALREHSSAHHAAVEARYLQERRACACDDALVVQVPAITPPVK